MNLKKIINGFHRALYTVHSVWVLAVHYSLQYIFFYFLSSKLLWTSYLRTDFDKMWTTSPPLRPLPSSLPSPSSPHLHSALSGDDHRWGFPWRLSGCLRAWGWSDGWRLPLSATWHQHKKNSSEREGREKRAERRWGGAGREGSGIGVSVICTALLRFDKGQREGVWFICRGPGCLCARNIHRSFRACWNTKKHQESTKEERKLPQICVSCLSNGQQIYTILGHDWQNILKKKILCWIILIFQIKNKVMNILYSQKHFSNK